MDTEKLIFKDTFKVRVPSIALMSDREIEFLGIPVNPGMTAEEQIATDVRLCYLPINRLVEIHDKGYTVSIPDRTDILKVYKNIQAHLDAWNRHMSTTVNNVTAPVEDLVLLDSFASTLFPYISEELVRHEAVPLSGGKYDDIGLMVRKGPEIKKEDVKRISMAGNFKARVGMSSLTFDGIND